jgi:hemerythrin-like metal-binding protein
LALVKWGKTYSVGVKILDEQHRGMMRVLNELHAAALAGRVGEVAGPLMSQVSCTAREHFSTEEELMEQTKFPLLEEHRAIHQELLTKASEYLAGHDDGNIISYVQLLDFVREWFKDHVKVEDKKYTVWMNEHGVR